MRHEEIQNLLYIYLDDMLGENQRAEVESHIRTCEDCKREVNYLRAVMRGIETYPLLDTPPNFVEDIVSTLQTTSTTQSRYWLEPIAPLLELPKFLFMTVTTTLREVASYYYISSFMAIRRTKRSLAFAISSARDNLEASFSDIKNLGMEWR